LASLTSAGTEVVLSAALVSTVIPSAP